MGLFCVVDSAAFADQADLDLTGIFQFRLDLLDNILCDKHHAFVGNLLRLDHNADFAACLDGEGLVDTREAACDLFKLLQTLDVVFQIFASCTGSCGGQIVCSVNNECGQRLRFYITVVRFNSMDDFLVFLVLAGDIDTELDMGAFDFLRQRLTDIMQKTCTLCKA